MNEENNLSKESKKKTLILTLIAIVTLSLVVIGATYAFFASQNTGKKDVNINAESGTTDVLSFLLADKNITTEQIKDEDNEETNLNITANMTNFNKGNISVGDGVTGTATLIANNATNNAQDNYNVYLYIDTNELRYTTFQNEEGEILEGKEVDGQIVAPDETHTIKVPELILTVTQPGEDGELTHIDNLDYKENVGNKGINGFDITGKTGLIPIAKNHKITATGSAPTVKAVQNWEIKVTLVNLDNDQTSNTNKTFTGNIIMQKDAIITSLADVCTSEEEIGECAKKLSKAEYTYSHLIYHNDKALVNSEIVNKETSANDNSYRYSGASEEVFNYVCLDGTSTENECNSDSDLYRIIGFFPNDTGEYEIKLIKYDYATKEELGDNVTAPDGAYKGNYSYGNTTYQGNKDNYNNIAGYYWNYINGSNSNNMWQYSNLNKKNLNEYYLNTYLAEISDLSEHITEHKWTTGGLDFNSSYTPKQVYDKELGTEKLTTSDSKCYAEDDRGTSQTCTEEDLTHTAKIGLMYLSDYGYAAYPEAWNRIITGSNEYGSKAVTENNWIYMGLYDWTVSRGSGHGNAAWNVNNTGSAIYIRVYDDNYGVRPVFYLDPSTKIKSGDGSKTNPFRLGWE